MKRKGHDLPRAVFGYNLDTLPKRDRAAWVSFWTDYYHASAQGKSAVAVLVLKCLLPVALAGVAVIGWHYLRALVTGSVSN